MGHAILERVLLFGTRSADYIRASGHNGCIATDTLNDPPLADANRLWIRFPRQDLARNIVPCPALSPTPWHRLGGPS